MPLLNIFLKALHKDVGVERASGVVLSLVRLPPVGTVAIGGPVQTLNIGYFIAPSAGTLTWGAERPGQYPKALYWVDHALVASGIASESVVVAGFNPVSIRAAGIASEDLEYD